MLRKDVLLEQLDQVRSDIIAEEKEKGRTVRVCSDTVLYEIREKRPLKLSDFLAISGIGEVFMNEYASRFLRVILDYQNASVREVKVSKGAYKVLDHYKDRLTNISRRNPNLYMGRVTKKHAFDLALLDERDDLLEFFTNKKRSIFKLKFVGRDKDMLDRHMTTLYRETNKDLKESGSYDLYLGYPYIEGIFRKDNFAIRAPLLYFPVKLARDKRNFSIKKDKDKDIIFNRDLLLATSKMEKNDLDPVTPYIDSFNKKTLKEVIVPFYQKNGIMIEASTLSFDFEVYPNITKQEFSKRKKGSFQLKEYVTLGRYKLYSSMIQKDMNHILDSNRYNDLLEGLIDEEYLYAKENDRPFHAEDIKVKERHLSYINEMNYAQEQVIDLLNTEQKLVIWGPPGTGKSQTITSLIASAIMKNQNVLVVSEKKVALDVIYSRLKNASRYAMFIDDAANKQAFYHQLKQFIDPTAPVRTLNNDIYTLEEEIEEILKTLDSSLDLLNFQKFTDVEIHKLYHRYVRDKDVINELSPKIVHHMFKKHFKYPSVKLLEGIEQTFDQKKHLEDYLMFHQIGRNYPLFQKLSHKLSRSQKIVFDEFDQDFQIVSAQMNHAGFFKKRQLKKRFIEKHQGTLLFLTNKKRVDKAYLKLLFEDATLHEFIRSDFYRISKHQAKHKKLTREELMFLDMLLDEELLKNQDVVKIRHYLFDAFYTGFLEDFEAKNQEKLYIVEKYREKKAKLEELMSEKRMVTEESFEMALYKHALEFSNTKRIMDIKRILDGTRKMSVKAFIDHFQLELISHMRIWMMTPEVVSGVIPLIYGMFDVVIFDEASQMYVEKGIPTIYRAKKVVIAGDTKQLRPSSLGIGRLEDEDEFFEEELIRDISMDAKSLLDLARYRYKETILNYHYRSKYEELIAFSNYAFYEGKLTVSPNQITSKKPPIEYVYVKDGLFEQRKNHAEAKKVIALLRKIFRERENNETIGVITFNSTQRDLIEDYIDEELFKRGKYQKLFERELFRTEDDEDQSLFVKNIENVQGDERDIIIFSMGYARNADGLIRRQFGWLNNEGGQNRLNVAISRAKQKIYFVSSLYPEELKVEDLKSVGPKLLKDYMRYCYYVSKKDHKMAKEVLHQLSQTEELSDTLESTDLEREITDRLEKGNYHVKRNIGIGAYTINLAVYDEETDTYNLGIICESGSMKNARKDLIHQEKYLEARGWKVYHVFESNWYKDPNAEMRNIREYLK
jgi:hypothetical protein